MEQARMTKHTEEEFERALVWYNATGACANTTIKHISIQAFICGMRAGKMDSAAICREVADRYPTDIFPHDGDSLDCKSARMARLTAANIEREILRMGDA